MTSIKVSYGTEIRRFTLIEETRGMSSFAGFAGTVRLLFPQLVNKTFSLVWHDEDGDKVTVSSDIEFTEALRCMKPTSGEKCVLRFEIVSSTERFTSTASGTSVHVFVHRGVTCDECGMNPIRGIRYKCTVRDDYDLCDSCEAKRVQPYPMIKISDPSQAPVIHAFRSQEERGLGNCPWKRGGYRRFNNAQGCPANTPAPTATAVASVSATSNSAGASASEEVPRWKARWDKRSERCGRRLTETVAPFISAFDKLVQEPKVVVTEGSNNVAKALSEAVQGVMAAIGVEDGTPKPAAAETEAPQAPLEDEMLQEAIQESLLLHEVATAFAETNPVELASVSSSTASAASAAAVAVHVPASAPAAQAPLPKPALRFIKDVSYPDGTVVQPGVTFRKSWRVRNDGQYAWPVDAVLVSAGGDPMTAEDAREVLPILVAGEEREIGIDLMAPMKTGLYTAYFRAQTKEKQCFGHRLWATVMVSEPAPIDVAAPASAPPQIATPSGRTEEEWTNVEATTVSSTGTTPAVTVPTTTVDSNEPATPVRPLHLLWRKELAVLNDMGFVDNDVNLPLLQQHLRTPVLLLGSQAIPNAEGMQRVIAALLGM